MQTVRRGLWLLLAVAALLLVLAAGALWLAWEPAPRLQGVPQAAAQPLLQLRAMARQHDPRRAEPGRLYVLNATPAELELLVGHAAAVVGGAAGIELAGGRMTLQASLPLPWRRPGGWLNLTLALGDGPALPTIERMAVGRLVLPGWAARPLVALALDRLDPGTADSPPLRQLLRGVRFLPERVQVVYEWRADVPRQLLARVVPPEQLALLRIYHDRLGETLRATRWPARLPALVQPMFALAKQRSDAGADPVAENRAALLTLALYVTGRPPSRAMPAARAWPALPWRPVVLGNRIDFAQHLLVSAAIAARAGGPLADVMGLAKEVSDARDGSGFSFNDMALNRAGVWLGEHVVREPRRAQSQLAAGVRDRDLMPAVADLPEFLPEPVFKARYGGIGAPAYEATMANIEARVAALPLWQPPKP